MKYLIDMDNKRVIKEANRNKFLAGILNESLSAVDGNEKSEDFEVKEFRFKVKHDNGFKKLKTKASSLEAAKQIIMNAEGCPEGALELISEMKKTYGQDGKASKSKYNKHLRPFAKKLANGSTRKTGKEISKNAEKEIEESFVRKMIKSVIEESLELPSYPFRMSTDGQDENDYLRAKEDLIGVTVYTTKNEMTRSSSNSRVSYYYQIIGVRGDKIILKSIGDDERGRGDDYKDKYQTEMNANALLHSLAHGQRYSDAFTFTSGQDNEKIINDLGIITKKGEIDAYNLYQIIAQGVEAAGKPELTEKKFQDFLGNSNYMHKRSDAKDESELLQVVLKYIEDSTPGEVDSVVESWAKKNKIEGLSDNQQRKEGELYYLTDKFKYPEDAMQELNDMLIKYEYTAEHEIRYFSDGRPFKGYLVLNKIK
jgi:hypothetical protein